LDDYLLKNSKSVLYRTLLKFLVDIAEGMMYLEREMVCLSYILSFFPMV